MAVDSTLRQWLPVLKKEAELGNPDAIVHTCHREWVSWKIELPSAADMRS